MAKGLPLEFKMLMDEVVVGYERHEIIDGEITILHSKDDNGWWPIACIEKKIPHDEKCQYTGFKAKNGKIYFGDKLIYKENKINTEPFIVMIDSGDICGKSKRAKIYPFSFQKYTELIDDTQ